MKRLSILLVLCTINLMAFAQMYDIPSLEAKAEQGDAKAQYDLYFCYANGIEVKKDENIALSYLFQSAENDNPEALYQLGLYYRTGEMGLPKWEEKALDYFSRSSELGYQAAQRELASLTEMYRRQRHHLRKKIYKQTLSVIPASELNNYENNKSKLIGSRYKKSFISLSFGLGLEMNQMIDYIKKDPYFYVLESQYNPKNVYLKSDYEICYYFSLNYHHNIGNSKSIFYILGCDVYNDHMNMDFSHNNKMSYGRIGINRWDATFKFGLGINAKPIYMTLGIGAGYVITNEWRDERPFWNTIPEPVWTKIETPPDKDVKNTLRPSFEFGFCGDYMHLGMIISSDINKTFSPIELIGTLGFRINTTKRNKTNY